MPGAVGVPLVGPAHVRTGGRAGDDVEIRGDPTLGVRHDLGPVDILGGDFLGAILGGVRRLARGPARETGDVGAKPRPIGLDDLDEQRLGQAGLGEHPGGGEREHDAGRGVRRRLGIVERDERRVHHHPVVRELAALGRPGRGDGILGRSHSRGVVDQGEIAERDSPDELGERAVPVVLRHAPEGEPAVHAPEDVRGAPAGLTVPVVYEGLLPATAVPDRVVVAGPRDADSLALTVVGQGGEVFERHHRGHPPGVAGGAVQPAVPPPVQRPQVILQVRGRALDGDEPRIIGVIDRELLFQVAGAEGHRTRDRAESDQGSDHGGRLLEARGEREGPAPERREAERVGLIDQAGPGGA